jgi:hypothetical protein
MWISQHALEQLKARYEINFRAVTFLQRLNASQPKFTRHGHAGTKVFEVEIQLAGPHETKVIRYLTDPQEKFIITVLPPIEADEAEMAHSKDYRKKHARTRQEFFRAAESTEEFETA